MGPRRWEPRIELDGALDRGELAFAVTLALELSVDGRAIDLPTALRFLPLVAEQRPADYDAWAKRWLARWATEVSEPTIETAAEIAASLADLPSEPSVIDRLRVIAA